MNKPMTREQLAPHKNRRIKVSGFFDRYGTFYHWEKYRTIPTACFQNVEIGDVKVASHIWVHYAEKLKECQLKYGERVGFEATVKEYKKKLYRVTEEGLMIVADYCLEWPANISLPERERVEVDGDQAERVPVEEPALSPQYGLDVIVDLKRLADGVGGWDRLQQLVDILRR